MIEATYQRDKKLRIRKEPSTEGEIIGFMEPNESAEVLEVVDGWCKIDDGYIMESLVVLTDDDEAAEQTAEDDDAAADNEAPEQEQATEDETANDDDAADDTATDDDEAAELRKMTNPQLYELCVNSGIKVKKNASKDAMIAALTNPDA